MSGPLYLGRKPRERFGGEVWAAKHKVTKGTDQVMHKTLG